MRHFFRPPVSLLHAQLDNIALVPGSLLPFKAKYQALANDLPQGGVLVCLPYARPRERAAMRTTADLLAGRGHHVKVVEAAGV